jgi:hypothetical protein
VRGSDRCFHGHWIEIWSDTKGHKAAKEKTYALVKEFTDLFVKERGSLECRELLACDITTPKGFKIAHEKNLFKTICPTCVESAVKILEKIL